jgi:hypothetical protein
MARCGEAGLLAAKAARRTVKIPKNHCVAGRGPARAGACRPCGFIYLAGRLSEKNAPPRSHGLFRMTFLTRRLGASGLVLVLPLVAAGAAKAGDWRFCVGVAPDSHETVITDIFASPEESTRLERRFEAYYRGRDGRALTFQCPRGYDDRTQALNAQTTALQFDQQMGFAVSNLGSARVAAIVGATD